MNEMVERVARALMAKELADAGWDEMAIAAIKAMREPTIEMLMATHEGSSAQEVDWKAMIDAALKSPAPDGRKEPG